MAFLNSEWMVRRGKSALRGTLLRVVPRRQLARAGRFLSDTARFDGTSDFASNGERALQESFVSGLGNEPFVVLDVGANVGDWTRSLLDLSGNKAGIVYTFEPTQATFGMLSERLKDLGARVELIKCAVSDAVGEGEMQVYCPGAGTNSLVAGSSSGPAEVERVPLVTLDSFSSERGLEFLDFVKIDTEGNDYRVLLGARELLAAHRIGMVQFEYNHRWIPARAYLRDAFELLQAHGYAVGKVTPSGVERYSRWDPELEGFREGNYLAMSAEWAKRLKTIEWWNA